MKWEDVKSNQTLIVTVWFKSYAAKFAVTKQEFEGMINKQDILQIFHCASNKYLDLDDVADQFDDWDLDQTAKKVAEWQIETCRAFTEMISISDQFFNSVDLTDRESNEWFWNALPLLDGLMESLVNFSGGETMP